MYYTPTFAIYKNDIKQTWTIIKVTLHRKTKCELPNQFFIGNRAVTNPDEIANEFNEYFVNIGRLLSEQITLHTPAKNILAINQMSYLDLLL